MILALLSSLAVCKAARISVQDTILDTELSTDLRDCGGVIRVDDGSRCLAVYGGNIHASDVTIYAAKCNGNAGQVWKHESGALKNVASGRCLDVDKASSKNGANLILYRCNGQENQQFQFNKNSIYQPKSSKCLDVDMRSNIKNVLLWTCKGSQNQKMDWAADWKTVHDVKLLFMSWGLRSPSIDAAVEADFKAKEAEDEAEAAKSRWIAYSHKGGKEEAETAVKAAEEAREDAEHAKKAAKPAKRAACEMRYPQDQKPAKELDAKDEAAKAEEESQEHRDAALVRRATSVGYLGGGEGLEKSQSIKRQGK